MWLDKTMHKILNETEEKFKDVASREQIKESFILYWKTVSLFMRDVRFPKIHIPKFGYLDPRITFIKEKLSSFNKNDKWGEDGPLLAEEAEKAIERIRQERRNRRRKTSKNE